MNGKTENRMENREMDGQGKISLSVRFMREISLWALLAKGSIYKVLTVLALMTAAEGCLFLNSLNRTLRQSPLVSAGFIPVFNYSGAVIVFLVAWYLIFIILYRCETENGGSRSGYTLDRLPVSDRRQMIVKLMYNILCFVLLFGVQAWIGLWMCRMYADQMPGELVSPQLAFLAFYQSSFLHNVLPLAESAKWVKNVLMILALSADLSVERKRRSFSTVGAFPALLIMWVSEDIGFHAVGIMADIVFITLIIVAVLQCIGVWKVDGSVQECGEE